MINAGIGGATLLGHVISITNHYPLHEWSWPNLAEMRDLLHQQPAIRDLDPDVVLLAAHWNDLTDFQAYLARGRVAPSGDGGTPPLQADQALAALFAHLDAGTPESLQAAEALRERMMGQPLLPAFDPALARQHLRFLTTAYAQRLRRYVPKAQLVLVTLPSHATYPGSDPSEAALQREVDGAVAAELGLPLIDLAGEFEVQFPPGSGARRAAVATMFTDPIHFSYRGNEWLADETGAALRALMASGAVR